MTATAPTRLLLVDDTADLRLLLRLAFESAGAYQVVAEAGDGLEALELAEALQGTIDLVILDLSMPRMDGLETLPRLRSRLPDVPVVVLSGFAASSTARAALDAGAALYLEKGLQPVELVGAIERAQLCRTDASERWSAPRGGGTATVTMVTAAATSDRLADRAAPPVPGPAAPTEQAAHEVVAELAHDVRSPLFVAREVVRLLRRSIDDEELRHLADRAMVAVDRVDHTLESAIEHARLGQQQLTLRCHELRGLLVEQTAALDDRAARRVRIVGPTVHARVDRGAFGRIVDNLLQNALRYSDGRVEVTTSRTEDGVHVAVRDHGPGLGESPEALFAPFARGIAGRDRNGTGLGLSTARRLAERMEGGLEGADIPGGGARFTLTLPAVAPPGGGPAPPSN